MASITTCAACMSGDGAEPRCRRCHRPWGGLRSFLREERAMRNSVKADDSAVDRIEQRTAGFSRI